MMKERASLKSDQLRGKNKQTKEKPLFPPNACNTLGYICNGLPGNVIPHIWSNEAGAQEVLSVSLIIISVNISA